MPLVQPEKVAIKVKTSVYLPLKHVIPCVTSTYMNVLETMTLTYIRQEKGQVYENNLLRRIVGVKRAYKRRMGELRVEVGVRR